MWTWAAGVMIAVMIGTSAGAETPADFADDFSAGPWAAWKSENAIAEFRHSEQLGNKEPGALEIVVGPDNPLTADGCFLRRFSIKPGKTYTALVYVRGRDVPPGSEVVLGFQGQDEQREFLGTGVQSSVLKGENVPDDRWRRIVLSFIVPETGKWENAAFLLCTFGLSHAVSGQVYFDDFEFFQAVE